MMLTRSRRGKRSPESRHRRPTVNDFGRATEEVIAGKHARHVVDYSVLLRLLLCTCLLGLQG